MTISVAATKPAQPSITSTNSFFTSASPSADVESFMRVVECKAPARFNIYIDGRDAAQTVHDLDGARANSARA